jgi:hypothetical protein
MDLAVSKIVKSEQIGALPGFMETTQGQYKWNNYEKTKKIINWVNIGIIGFLGLIILTVFFDQGFFGALITGIILFLIYGAIYWVLEKVEKGVEKSYYNERWDYSLQLGEKLSSITESRAFCTIFGEIFLYSNRGCALVDVEYGTVKAVAMEDIKEVTLRHVHLGSESKTDTKHRGYVSSFTNTYKGTSSSTTSSVDYYAWRLEIYTRVPDPTNINIDYGDDENTAKDAYAVLKK